MKAKTYNQEGKEIGEVGLPAEVFGLQWNPDLVHQVVTAMQSSARPRLAWARDRGDVSGGGKKPWRQKGTGRSRHGSSRSPIWKGGGVTHGPTAERSYAKKINAKMKKKALAAILSAKFRDGEILFLDGFNLPEAKTRHFVTALNLFSALPGYEKINYKKGKRVLWSLPVLDQKVAQSARNISTLKMSEVRNLNPISALTYKYIVITDPAKSLPILKKRVSLASK